jgi:hypothetical protein
VSASIGLRANRERLTKIKHLLLAARRESLFMLLRVKNGNPTYFFISGEGTPKGAVSTIGV